MTQAIAIGSIDMDSQVNNLYEMASEPDSDNDVYTFLEFNMQGVDFDYPKLQELSLPIQSASIWPTPFRIDCLDDGIVVCRAVL